MLFGLSAFCYACKNVVWTVILLFVLSLCCLNSVSCQSVILSLSLFLGLSVCCLNIKPVVRSVILLFGLLVSCLVFSICLVFNAVVWSAVIKSVYCFN